MIRSFRNPEFESVDTDELVDAPTLVASGSRHITERAAGAAALATVNGSGSTNQATFTAVAETGTTADSFARLAYLTNSISNATFANDVTMRINCELTPIGGDADDHLYVAVAGSYLSEDTYIGEHIGIGTKGGDLVITTADGTTQDTTVITANVATGKREMWLVWDGTSVEAYDDKLPNSNSPDATQTSNLPSTDDLDRVLQIADNGAAGNANRIALDEYELGVGT